MFGFSNIKNKRMRKRFSPARILVLGFVTVIIIGALLLSIPISSRSGTRVEFLTALFTSASATCITGLTVTDTALTWSLTGRIIILCLIQLGGLGFMSVASVFFSVMHKKINLSQRLLIMHSLNLNDVRDIIQLVWHVIIGTFVFETAGAVALWTRSFPEYGLMKGLGMGVFHSVSAFCNAGFDLMGEKGEFSSLRAYSGDTTVMIVIILLVIIGGLGFFFWEDVWHSRCFKKLHLHSKMVIVTSGSLLLLGWIFFYLSERKNPLTIGNMSLPNALFASLFQSVMPRSGGFSIVDQNMLAGVSKMTATILMFIGGSAGSTAGGIKNVTAGILFLSAINALRGKPGVSVFKRTIPPRQIVSAISIMIMSLTVCFTGTVVIALLQPELSISGIIFEVVSAVATCGLSHGITSILAPVPIIIIVLFMLFGRVGIMTLGMAAFVRRSSAEKIKYPDSWVMM